METFRYKQTVLWPKLWRSASIALLLLFGPLVAFGQESESRVQSTIQQVTVFLNQAQVNRVAKVNLQAGTTHLVFEKISPYINLNSLQVKTEQTVTLLSVSQRNSYINSTEKPAHIVLIEDTLESLQSQLQLLNIRKEALDIEKEVIQENKRLGGDEASVKVEELEDALTLFRKRTQEIGEELMRITKNINRLTLIQQRFQIQLDDYMSNQHQATEIVVSIKSLTNATGAKVELTYLVGNVSWTPFYDLRVKDTKSKLQLVSKAYITQQTGEDWKNVVLKLSASNPTEGGNKPELNPVYLNYYTPQTPNIRGSRADGTAYYIDGVKVQESAKYKATTGIALPPVQTQTSVEYVVAMAHTILSNNRPHQVDLTTTELDAQYAYGVVPKLDKDAFVTAKVAANDIVNQVTGEANVYFDGTFSGKSTINTTASDSVLLTLGRDKRIQIQRNQLKDFSSKTFVGGSKKELNTWEISIRNTRKEAITIVVEDQIPVSNNKEIEVKLVQAVGATYDEMSGKLTWTITIEAEKTVNLKFSFEVKYPKDQLINPY